MIIAKAKAATKATAIDMAMEMDADKPGVCEPPDNPFKELDPPFVDEPLLAAGVTNLTSTMFMSLSQVCDLCMILSATRRHGFFKQSCDGGWTKKRSQ
jgi:hypothetical protein